MNNVKITRLGSNFVGDIVDFEIEFTSTEYLRKNNGDIKIFFPFDYVMISVKNLEYVLIDSNNNLEIQKMGEYACYSNTEIIRSIIIFSISNSNCNSINLIFRIKNLRNPTTTRPLTILNSTNFLKIIALTLDQKIISSQQDAIIINDLSNKPKVFTRPPSLKILDPTTSI
jgi:hypothetical protein